MSAAKPMRAYKRMLSYLTANGHPGVTGRQWRRAMHKYNRANGSYYGHWGEGRKGHATPRQKAASGPGRGQGDG